MASTETKGIESLKAAVMRDCEKHENCFNENGCDKQSHKFVPETDPNLVKMGITSRCVPLIKCEHLYCDKYKWVIDRATEYAKLSGKSIEEIITAWETRRDYWYMNFYQDCKQPPIDGNINIIFYEDWKQQLIERFGEDSADWKFVCPKCSNVQCGKDFEEIGVSRDEWVFQVYYSCIGRSTKSKGCDWTLGGLISLHKTVVFSDGNISPVFEMADVDERSKQG